MAVAIKGGDGTTAWDAAVVRRWLESRVVAARSDQMVAERAGRSGQDDCDRATAEEMVCTLLVRGAATDAVDLFLNASQALLDRDDHVWRGVYDDRRFDRHVRAFIRKVVRMARTDDGFANRTHYQ